MDLIYVPTLQKNQPLHIRAELIGDNTCAALGIEVCGNAPVFDLCRSLIEAGHDPALPLEAWRGGTLCLRVRSIGEAAGLDLNSKGTGFVRWRWAVRTGPPVARNALEHGIVGGPSQIVTLPERGSL